MIDAASPGRELSFDDSDRHRAEATAISSLRFDPDGRRLGLDLTAEAIARQRAGSLG